MNRDVIQEKLNEIFVDVFDDESIRISDETSAEDIEDWDSLMHVSLIMSIENEFEIKFSMDEVTSMKKVGDMISLIEKKVAV